MGDRMLILRFTRLQPDCCRIIQRFIWIVQHHPVQYTKLNHLLGISRTKLANAQTPLHRFVVDLLQAFSFQYVLVVCTTCCGSAVECGLLSICCGFVVQFVAQHVVQQIHNKSKQVEFGP